MEYPSNITSRILGELDYLHTYFRWESGMQRKPAGPLATQGQRFEVSKCLYIQFEEVAAEGEERARVQHEACQHQQALPLHRGPRPAHTA